MIFPKTKKIAAENNWHRTDNTVFGLYKNYFFTIGDSSLLSSPNYKYIIAKVDHLTQAQKLEISNALLKNKSELKFTQFEFRDDKSLTLFYHETFGFTKIALLYQMLDFLSGLFSLLGFESMLKCHISGETNDLQYYTVNGEGMILSKKTAFGLEKELEALRHQHEISNKNYFGGFLGSILFSLTAVILWVFIAVYFNRLASGVAFIIGFLGLKGYKYFKGKSGKYSGIILIFSNIIVVLISSYLTVIYLLFQQSQDFSFAINELNNNQEVRKYFFTNLIISFIISSLTWLWIFMELRPGKVGIKLATEVSKK